MADLPDDTIDDAVLTKPKKQRSEAQKAATERMRKALESKNGLTADEKKLRLKAIKEQLNGPLKKDLPKKPVEPVEEPDEPDDEPEEEPEPVVKPVKTEKKKAVIISQPPKKKKEPKVIYESESEASSEEEVIVIKKKKKKPENKKKKKTIIYEESSDTEEEPVKPIRKERETKTQQNAASKFKVTPGLAEKPKPTGPIYYFAD